MQQKSGNKGKASGFKLTNKKTNKLAKRGQLDHQKKKRKESLKAKKLAEISKGTVTLYLTLHAFCILASMLCYVSLLFVVKF